MTPAARLVRRLDLDEQPIDAAVADMAEPVARNYECPAGQHSLNRAGRVFGGFVLAQTMIAAGRSYPERRVHMVQQLFLRPGQPEVALRYRVWPLYEGRTYASVRVEVHQDEVLISHAHVGLTAGVAGPDRAEAMPPMPAQSLTVNREVLENQPDWNEHPVDFTVAPDELDDGAPRANFWIHPNGVVEGDLAVHQAVLGFASDRAMMRTGAKAHRGLDFTGSTLSHSLWLHRPVDVNQWLAYRIQCPTLCDGRGMMHGQIYNAEGRHVATTAQEGAFRFTEC